ncbi:hypothetical protein ACFZB5_13665 [Streptomyces nodosus]|uniref:hypothetical protein n=1 Tax=Streptomyces nodosus TaxID=40318 RepID=UPI0036ED55A1
MSLDQPITWTTSHLWQAALIAGVLVTLCTIIVRRTSGAVLTAGIGALICTAYSGDTSWRFAEHRLHMADHGERMVMFAAGEGALLACAVMARANKKATATEDAAGTPGVPGVLVWCITGIQIIPAFAESGFWAGIVRAAIGPAMAALLWHLAMGLEIRVARPEALSTGLPAQIGHELRERLLSHLGLAVRGRTAAQVTRDRATARAVRLASRRWLSPWGRAALKASVARSGAAADGTQRHTLMQLLAARRSASLLRTIDVASPWTPEPAPEPHPATPLGVTGAELRRMDPVDAIRHVHDAHPDADPTELASLVTEYGVPVSPTQVRIALHPRAAQPSAQPVFSVQPRALPPAAQSQPGAVEDFDAVAASALAIAQPPENECAIADAQASEGDAQPLDGDAQLDALILDLATMLPPHPEMCAPAPDVATQPATQSAAPKPRTAGRPRRRPAATRAASSREVVEMRIPDADAQLLERARELNAQSLSEDGRKAPLRLLQNELGIGQRRAQRIQAQLPASLTPVAADAQPSTVEATR